MAKLSSMMWIGPDEVSASTLRAVKRALTVTPRPSPLEDVSPLPIEQFVEDREGWTGIPIAFGEEKFPDLNFVEDFSEGEEFGARKFPDPEHPSAAPEQGKFFEDLLVAVEEYSSVLVVAPTGSGKTVAGLNTAGKLDRTTLAIVPSKEIAKQWVSEAVLHMGLKREEIGLLQGSKDEWGGKKLVVAVIHNLFLKEWSPLFYRYFGLVIWDEAHRLGARKFASTMTRFYARHKVAMTATPERNDGCSCLYENYFGEVTVEAEGDALPCDCFVIPFQHFGEKHLWIEKCKSDQRPMKWLAGLEGRNEMLVRLICKLYDQGYYTAGVSRYINHAQDFIKELVKAGIPEDHIGEFTGKCGEGYLNKIKANCPPILIGTYAKLSLGVNIPILDAGVELLPAADNVQTIGRIRRPLAGKGRPKWFSVDDRGIGIFMGYTRKRLRGFTENNVRIKYLKKGAV